MVPLDGLVVPLDGQFVDTRAERQAGELADHGGVELRNHAERARHRRRIERRHKPTVHTRGVVAIRRGPHRGDRSVGELGDQFLGGCLGEHGHGVTVDGRITVEETTEMLDVAHAHGSALELDHVEYAGVEEPSTEGDIGGTLGVVDDAVVDVRVHLGVGLEHDFAGEGMLARLVQRHPGRLCSVDRQCGGRRRVGHRVGLVHHFRQPPPCLTPWTRGASGGFRQ